jgi:hypothetical protein
MGVRNADCCLYCKHKGTDYTFRDAILCNKRRYYVLNTSVCDDFERKEDPTSPVSPVDFTALDDLLLEQKKEDE